MTINKPTTKQQATTNAILALEEAESTMVGINGRFVSASTADWAARRAEVWTAIGRGWAAVADNLPEERVIVDTSLESDPPCGV